MLNHSNLKSLRKSYINSMKPYPLSLNNLIELYKWVQVMPWLDLHKESITSK